jgi:hypothetical protein
MDLSQEILKGLEFAGDSKQFPDGCFKELVEVTFGVLIKKFKEDKLYGTILKSNTNRKPQFKKN